MSGDVTALLLAWRGGDTGARDRLAAVVYPELRLLADRQFRGERAQHTLQPTALVNEAWMRLSGLDRIDWQDRAHFVRMAARLMREILVDHARRRDAAKRDGGQRVTLTGLEVAAEDTGLDVMSLDAALARLEAPGPGQGAGGRAALFRRADHRGNRRGHGQFAGHGEAPLAGGPHLAVRRAGRTGVGPRPVREPIRRRSAPQGSKGEPPCHDRTASPSPWRWPPA
ncbi:ECF-type sigma factor [Arenimonas daejeonensis]|uniref:ECF-type sigma factor n=1 Tax=Arenimonas daejeonensis TaxID=370777 RepID=UPI00223F4022|nr:ECF-type sigma factor [Arenimonas daejeonensis]